MHPLPTDERDERDVSLAIPSDQPTSMERAQSCLRR